jgi:tubulin monoglycylase TTLL3/8
MSERNDFEDFLEDFKTSKAISLLMQFLNKLNAENVNENKLKVAIDICERKIYQYTNFHSDNSSFLSSKVIKLISDREWYIIGEEDVVNYNKEVDKLEKMNKIGFIKSEKRSNSLIPDNRRKENINKVSTFIANKMNKNKKEAEEKNSDLEKYRAIVENIINKFQKINPQHNLNGEKNIWILKPSGLSRGRGITCINNLNETLNFIKKNSNQYIIQKYIEDPIIILGRKVIKSIIN